MRPSRTICPVAMATVRQPASHVKLLEAGRLVLICARPKSPPLDDRDTEPVWPGEQDSGLRADAGGGRHDAAQVLGGRHVRDSTPGCCARQPWVVRHGAEALVPVACEPISRWVRPPVTRGSDASMAVDSERAHGSGAAAASSRAISLIKVFARWSRDPMPARMYSLLIILTALGVTGWGVAVDGNWDDAEILAALTVGGSIDVETGRLASGGRRAVAGRVQWGLSAWLLAAAFLVAPTLVGLVAAPLYLHERYRGPLPYPPGKWITSGAVVTLSAWAAGSLFSSIVGSRLRPGDSAEQLGALIAAMLVFLAVEVSLFFVISRLNSWYAKRQRARLGSRDFYFSELAVLATGGIAAVLYRFGLGFLALMVPLVVIQQRAWLYLPLKQESLRDPRTQLLNSQAWRRAAQSAARRERAGGRPYAVAFLDLDHFKAVNDGYGHVVGDEVLISVAGELSRLTRPADLVGRYGGEEFCILLLGAAAEQAAGAAERLRAGVAALRFPTQGLQVTVSIGVAIWASGDEPRDSGAVDELMDRADQALYAAKNAGRDRICIWTPGTTANK